MRRGRRRLISQVMPFSDPRAGWPCRQRRMGPEAWERPDSRAAAELDDLTTRLRHPRQWMFRHPVRSARRHGKLTLALTVIGVAVAVVVLRRRSYR
jgi:hypothetical protein